MASHGHHRRTSEPVAEASEDRRNLFERGWSTSHLQAGNQASENPWVHSLHATEMSTSLPAADLPQLHASWTNTYPTTLQSDPIFIDSLHFGALDSSFPPTQGDLRLQSTAPRALSLASKTAKNQQDSLSSQIHDAARITDWDRVLKLCRSSPEHAKYRKNGWTALHHACNRRCPRPEVVEALIEAYPDALLKEEEKGWLPVHYACRFKAPKEVVRLLLHKFPDKGRAAVSKRDRLGRTPLYYAVRYDAPPGVVGLLLQVDPSVVLEEDQNEDSPLALVWDSWAEKSEGIRVLTSYFHAEQQGASLREKLEKDSKLLKRWQQVNMLLRAAFGFSVDEDLPDQHDRVWRVVHATAAVKCHKTLFQLACALYPEQVRELDCHDLRSPGDHSLLKMRQTALHLAVSSNSGGETGKFVVSTLLRLYPEAAQIKDEASESLPLHRLVENECKQNWGEHVALLYAAFPRAVRVQDSQARLPLHRAALAAKHADRAATTASSSIICNLVANYPQGTSQADSTGHFPLHLMARHHEEWNEELQEVYDAYPRAVQVRASGRLPLHIAASSPDSRCSLLEKLVELHPRGCEMMDHNGKLPVHLACEVGKDRSCVEALLGVENSSVIERPEDNSRGWLALHMACHCATASHELLSYLVDLSPSAAGVADEFGRYPLHLACASRIDWQSLALLFEAFPQAVSSCDASGRLPFHICAIKCRDDVTEDDTPHLEVMYSLLRSDPSIILSFARG